MVQLVNTLRLVRDLHYGWRLAGISFFLMVVGSVPLFQGIPAWFVVLREKFGWSSGQMSWTFALTRAEGGLLGPLWGYLTDRLGSRRMVLIGFPIQGVGFILFSLVNDLWHLYLAFLVMSLGSSIGVWMPVIVALNNWFTRRRALAMGIPMAGFLTGGVFLIPVLAWAIDPDQFGLDRWRWAARVIGVFLIAVAVPLFLLIRDRPEDYGQRPYGEPAGPEAASQDEHGSPRAVPSHSGFRWQEAVRMREFWLIAIGHACISAMYSVVMVHLGLVLDDRGLSLQTLGWIVATAGLVGGIFTLVGGYMGERVPIARAVFVFSMVQSVAVVVLLLADSATMGFLFAVLLGIGFGGRIPLTTAIRGVYFGRRAFARITAISHMPLDLLHFAAPLFAGYMRDYTGSYDLALGVVIVTGFLGSMLFLLLGQPRPFPLPAVAGTRQGDV